MERHIEKKIYLSRVCVCVLWLALFGARFSNLLFWQAKKRAKAIYFHVIQKSKSIIILFNLIYFSISKENETNVKNNFEHLMFLVFVSASSDYFVGNRRRKTHFTLVKNHSIQLCKRNIWVIFYHFRAYVKISLSSWITINFDVMDLIDWNVFILLSSKLSYVSWSHEKHFRSDWIPFAKMIAVIENVLAIWLHVNISMTLYFLNWLHFNELFTSRSVDNIMIVNQKPIQFRTVASWASISPLLPMSTYIQPTPLPSQS